MSSKTWFLPPDFTFLPSPTSPLALGNIIPSPHRPTSTLASLAPHPTIAPALPPVRTLTEKNRTFTTSTSRSLGLALLADFLALASAHARTERARSCARSFSPVDHDVRFYDGVFAPEVLKEIVDLDAVKRHMESGGRFGGKRCVYLITGLRVATGSFTVTEERGKRTVVAVGGEGLPVVAAAAAGGVSLGASVEGGREEGRTVGYETAPGVVFAYRLHVIRVREGGAEGELFEDRTAFFTGEADEEDGREEMEIVGVDGPVLRQDLDLEWEGYEERTVEEGDGEAYVVFGSATGEDR